MKTTIIIPSYNQQDYLPDAIESALAQTAKCEVVVIDDGSTDSSLEIAKKYPVKVISQVNKGLASARNTGIMNATTEFILPLDADDVLQDNCVETLEHFIGENDVAAPSFKNFGADDSLITLMPNPQWQDFVEANRIGYCALIQRSSLLEVGGYSPRMTFGYEDYALWFDLLKRGKKIVTHPEPLWLYRVKKESMLIEARKHHAELMAQINKDHHIYG